MYILALTYWKQGRDEADSEKLQIEVVEMSKKKLGTDHPETLSSINQLALIYHSQERWKEAVELQVEVMEMPMPRCAR